ncbi:RHS repeat domain-containing protein [Paludibaculum fermentans]|uniref:RHS repeat-associated core domain-containing protein n=1 Tax=Paludibaculum fermentans TaxID=1473598 RepID=A0A7S7NUF8_PALFE|nr:RHS repeat-associated core domain-containing protein [Paludibaculum fermentans]QOY90035.1 RHS repeat-associated core domain-containing protein [Paludibaculum fermentans]
MRSVTTQSGVLVYLDNVLKVGPITTPFPNYYNSGLGIDGMAGTGNGFYSVDLGALDVTAPNPVSGASIVVSAQPTSVGLSWAGASDSGTGTARYVLYRNGAYLSETPSTPLTDTTVTPTATYTYTIYAVDFHNNWSTGTNKTVTVPTNSGPEWMRRGLRPTSSYWGGEGENIGLFSGNVNFALPLITAVGRNGWKLPLGLSYNSQNWKQDQSGTYNSGQDIGYGYGWIMTPGKIKPSYSDSVTVHHYTYTDPSGAEYHLDVNESGKWRTKEGPLVRFEASTQKLWFPDGSYWCFYGLSGGNEADAGTMYPTDLYDRNGNLTKIQYMQGSQAPAGSTSGRIATIADIRASQDLGAVFQFEYNTDAVPHLIRITNLIAPDQKFEFTYSTGQTLKSPFSPYGTFGTTTLLTTVTHMGLGLSHTFAYATNNSGELDNVTMPRGGRLRWSYTDILYGNQQRFREVNNRWLRMCTSCSEYWYEITAPGSVPTAGHLSRTIVDPGNSRANDHVWYFDNSVSSAYFGFTTKEEERVLTPSQRALVRWETTWTVNSNQNPYASVVTTKLDPGTTSEKVSKVEFTRDGYLNATEERQYDYEDLTTPARRAWKVMDTTMASQGMYDRVQSVGVTAGSQTVTTAQFKYDGAASTDCGSSSVALTDAPNITFHDSAFGTSKTDRGLPTWVSQLGKPNVCVSYNIAGNVIKSREPSTSKEVAVTLNETTKYTVPSMTTPNGNSNLATSYQWNQMLGLTQTTGANGATSSFTYDSIQRPATTTNAHGGVSTYSYWTNSTAVATDAGSQGTDFDGFGRTVQSRVGSPSATLSITDTQYAPCACSPTGKLKRVSRPYAVGGTPKYTEYTYDGRGRTVTVALPDSAGQTTYLYEGNTVLVTSPVRDSTRPIWKKYIMDAFGNLVHVIEPNPAYTVGGSEPQEVITDYTYNLFNQLRTVTMRRGTTTQTRTFNYNSLFQLTSVVQPESGTTSYTYWTDGQIRTKTDAKGNVTTYVRDGYGRLGAIYRKPSGAPVDDPTQTTTYGYDTGVNAQGRLSSVAVGAATETYEYTAGGLVSKKSVTFPNNDTPLQALYTYDTLGRMISLKYPDVYNSSGAVAEVGRTLGYQYFDPMGPQKLTDSTYTSPGWRVTAQRNAAGQLTQMVVCQPNGTSETETFSYNSLGQLTQSSGRGSNIEYRYSTTGNDGRITSRKDNISGEEVSYTYDQLGRLIEAVTTGPEWGLTWAYDGFGNRLRQEVTKGGRAAVFSVDPATNRLSGGGVTYDANGSIESFGTGAGTGAYDVDNRMVSMSLDASNVERYAYSAANQRIQVTRANGTVETFFYGLAGELLGVYQRGTKANGHKYFSSASIRVWFSGRLISSGANSVVTDRLGSVVKDGSEALRYYPYGDQNPGSTTEDREKFATYTRDGFSGLDYAQNRYYSSQWGRFTSADPYGGSARPRAPQSWNRYSYTDSDPINRNDSSGLCWWCRFSAPDDFGIQGWLDSQSEVGGGDLDWWVPATGPGLEQPEPGAAPALPPLILSGQESADVTTAKMRGWLTTELDTLSAGCKNALSNYMGTLRSNIQNLKFYDATLAEGFLLLNQVDPRLSGSQSIRGLAASMIANNPNSSVTAFVLTVTDAAGTKMTNNIILTAAFSQISEVGGDPHLVLLHEALHSILNKDDNELAKDLGISISSGQTSSSAITQWLGANCPKP